MPQRTTVERVLTYVRRSIATGCLLAAVLALPVPASATWAGKPGRISYDPLGEIRAVRPDGSGDRQLVPDAARPEWSRGGRWLLFLSQQRLERMRADGTHRRVLVSADEFGDTLLWGGAWSPSGKRVVFSTEQEVTPDENGDDFYVVWRVYVVGWRGRHLHRVVRGGHSPVWSRDGRFIYYVDDDGDIVRIRPNGKGKHVLVHQGGGWGLDLSPNGRRLAYISQQRGDLDYEVRVLNLHSGRQTRIPVATGSSNVSIGDVGWTPSGRRLVFLRRSYDGPDELQTMRPDGSDPRTLLQLHETDPTTFSWRTR